MGNCQAAEAATVIIYHRQDKIERIYWSVSAHKVMTSNRGHYIGLVVNSPTMKSENGTPLKQLKLLRPDDTLLIGHVYRLVRFEDVLKEVSAKKSTKLGKLLKESGGVGVQVRMKNLPSNNSNPTLNPQKSTKGDGGRRRGSGGHGSGSGSGRPNSGGGGGGGQWRPALRSIDEVGT